MKTHSCLLRPAGKPFHTFSGALLILTACCFFQFTDLSAQYPWVQRQSGTTADLVAVSFVDDLHGYIATEDGDVLTTFDGGLHWHFHAHVDDIVPTRMVFTSHQRGWLTGNYDHVVDSAAVFHTTDGGVTWQPVFKGIHFNLFDIQFRSDTNGWVAGFEVSETDTLSLMMYTTSEGFSWSIPFGPRAQTSLYSIDFRDDLNGASCGHDGLFYTTTNGGMSPTVGWGLNLSIPTYNKDLYRISSSGAGYGCAVGQDGFVLVTKDKWTAHLGYTVSSGDTLNAVTGFSGIPQFYAVGNNGCIASIRYALYMWMISEETRITSSNLNDICQVGDLHQWAVGDNGTVLYHTNNFPPLAADDMASVRQDSSVKIYVLDNDTDPDFHTLDIYSYENGNHGVVIPPDGEKYLQYHPDNDYAGWDTLTYTITDHHGGYDTAHVYVEIREAPPGVFVPVEIPHDTIAFGNAIWGDIDGDRYYDILVCGEQANGTKVTALYINHEGTFEKSAWEFEGLRAGNDHAMAFTDLNRNSYLDFIITGVDQSGDPATLLYLYEYGYGYVEFATDIPGVQNASVDWGDFDRDGDPDLLICGNTGTEKICRIYRNDGRGDGPSEWIFTDAHVNFHGLDQGAARFVDFNRDRYLDVVSAGRNADHTRKTYYYTNLEGLYVVGELDGYDQCMIDVCDYNPFGNYEILISGIQDDGQRHAEILSYNGSFTEMPDQIDGLSNGSTSWGDYDNDGDYDLLVCGIDDQLALKTLLYDNHSGMLEHSTEFLPGMASGTVAWGDYDADGDLDILASGYFNTEPNRITRIYRNTLEVDNQPPDLPERLDVSRSGDDALLSWPPAADSETGEEGITYHMTIKRKKQYIKPVCPVSDGADYSEVAAYGNVRDTAIVLTSLEPGALYTCSIQSVDAGFHVSGRVSFDFNAPSLFFLEQDLTIKAFGISAAEWFRYDSDSIPELLLAMIDQDHSSLLEWNGAGFDTLVAAFGPGGGLTQPALLDFNTDNEVDFSEVVYADSSIEVYVTGVDTLKVKTGIRNPSYDWGDYDRDGDPDLIITGNISDINHITKLFRNEDGELIFYNTLIPGVQYGDIAWVDFDGDGDEDVAITGYNETFEGITRFYENRGGGFVQKEMDVPGLFFSSFDFSDYDGDGDMDMLICGLSGEGPLTKIYRNNDGAYTETTHHLDHIMQGTCKWVDLYQDGKSDVILLGNTEDELHDGRYTGIVYAFYDGDYVEVSRMEQMPGPIIALGDYDGNRSLDFAFAGSPGGSSQIYLYRNNTYISSGVSDPPRNLSALAYGDSVLLTWDHPPLFQHNFESPTYNIRMGTVPGSGNILSPLADSQGHRKVYGQGNVPYGTSRMVYGLSPDSTYYAAVQTVRPSFIGTPFTSEILFNPKSGTLIPEAFYRSNRYVRNADWADIDSDGDPDLLMDVHNTIDAYENMDGSIDFSQHTRLVDMDITGELLLNDFDNDNDADILLLSTTDPSANSMLENQAGVYTEVPLDLQGLYKAVAAWGELDNDGRSDLVISGLGTPNSELHTYVYAQRDDGFESLDNLLVPTWSGEVHWVDIDNDGDMDLVRCGITEDVNVGPEDIRLLINRNMGGAFDKVDHDLPGLNYGSLEFGDYDNDGDPDMLYTGADPHTGLPHSYICENTGSTFVKADSIIPLFSADAKWVDLNNDGSLDIVISGINDEEGNLFDPDVKKFTGVFLHRAGGYEQVATLATYRTPAIAVADFDGDGRQDVFLGGYTISSDTLGILYRNHTADQNTPPGNPFLKDPEVYADSVVIDWNRSVDADGHGNMMYYNLRIGSASGGGDVISPLAHADGTRIVQGMGNMQQTTSYAIRGLEPATTYYAAVQAIDKGMAPSGWSTEKSFTTEGTAVEPVRVPAFDATIYPVPARDLVRVEVVTPFAGKVSLEVFDALGREVLHVTDRSEGGAATFRVSLAESGLYLARIVSGDKEVIRKIVVTQ